MGVIDILQEVDRDYTSTAASLFRLIRSWPFFRWFYNQEKENEEEQVNMNR